MGMLWSPPSLVFPISIRFELMLPGESPFSHSDYIIFYFKVLHLLTCFIVFFGHLFLFWGFFCWERSVFLLDSLPLASLPLLLFLSDLDHFSFSPASLIFLLKVSWIKKSKGKTSPSFRFLLKFSLFDSTCDHPTELQCGFASHGFILKIMFLCIHQTKVCLLKLFFLKLLQSFHQLLIRSHFSPQLLI